MQQERAVQAALHAAREREVVETIIRHYGRYTLVQTEKGFVWCLTDGLGDRWYWHTKTRQWLDRRECCPTEAAAAVGFDPSTPERIAAALMNLLRLKQ